MELSGRDVFEIFVTSHSAMLRAFLHSTVRSGADVDDLLQETLTAAWKSLPNYDRSRPLAPWLRGIASNVLADWRRTRARRDALLCDEPTLAFLEARFRRLDDAPGETWEEKTSALRDCLGRLDADDRRVIDLRYTDGLACEPIARALDRGVEWVKKRLQRARAQLALCVEGKL
jgi:RNA polymerase sigma-70 factor (ECF subfamily)